VGGPSDLYLMVNKKGSKVLGEYWNNRLVPLWFYEQVKVLDGAEVIMDVVTGDGRQPRLPGIITSNFGNGKVIYCTSSIESLYLEEGIYVLGELIRDMIEVVAPEKRPYTIDAPSSLMTNLGIKDDTWVIHMTNWTGNKFERAQINEYYLAPVENVRVTLRVPENKSVREISPFVNTSFDKKLISGTIELLIPRVEAYQGIRVKYK
jgi:hypothetical protein